MFSKHRHKLRLGTMDDCERRVLQKFHHQLTQLLPYKTFIDILSQDRILNGAWRQKHNSLRDIGSILDVLPDRCSMRIFLSVLTRIHNSEIMAIVDQIKRTTRRWTTTITFSKPKLGQNKKFDEQSRLAHMYQRKVYDVNGLGTMAIRSYFEELRNEKFDGDLDTIECSDVANVVFTLTNAILDTERTYMDVDTPLHLSSKFEDLKQLPMKTSFPDHAQSVYLSRFAAALGIDGDIDGAIYTARESLEMIDLEVPSRGNVNIIYAYVNTLLRVYEKLRHCDEIKVQLLSWIETGLKQVEGIEKEFQQLWRNMLLAKKAFVYLGLGHSSMSINDVIVSKEDVIRANVAIQKLKKSSEWCTVDRRRRMLVCIAEARIARNINKQAEFYRYLRKAYVLAKDTFQGEFKLLKADVENESYGHLQRRKRKKKRKKRAKPGS